MWPVCRGLIGVVCTTVVVFSGGGREGGYRMDARFVRERGYNV